MYSQAFTGKRHILGSTLPLEEVEISDREDVFDIMDKAGDAIAKEARAIMIMVSQSSLGGDRRGENKLTVVDSGRQVPLSNQPPYCIGLFPSAGKDKAEENKELIMEAVNLVAQFGGKVLSIGQDGASAEFKAQSSIGEEHEGEFLEFHSETYNIHLKAPIIHGTPLVAIQDPSHAKKTLRNNLQSGALLLHLGHYSITFANHMFYSWLVYPGP